MPATGNVNVSILNDLKAKEKNKLIYGEYVIQALYICYLYMKHTHSKNPSPSNHYSILMKYKYKVKIFAYGPFDPTPSSLQSRVFQTFSNAFQIQHTLLISVCFLIFSPKRKWRNVIQTHQQLLFFLHLLIHYSHPCEFNLSDNFGEKVWLYSFTQIRTLKFRNFKNFVQGHREHSRVRV